MGEILESGITTALLGYFFFQLLPKTIQLFANLRTSSTGMLTDKSHTNKLLLNSHKQYEKRLPVRKLTVGIHFVNNSHL